MKNTLTKTLLSLAFALGGAASHAQLQAPAIAYIDTNNIRAAVLASGDLWKSADSGEVVEAGCYFPAAENKTILFAGGLWFGGFDPLGNMHIKTTEYRQQQGDFVPGPLYGPLGSAQVAHDEDTLLYDKVWMITSADIAQFLAQPSHTLANTPPHILEWPGYNNPYARGRNGQLIPSYPDRLAPFVDVDGDGSYNPLQGDYPAMKGHQMAWTVFNESGARHNPVTATASTGIQVHASAYAFHAGGLLDNVVFYEHEIWNRGPEHLDSFSLGMFVDGDLGYAFDDLVRFDSARRMAVYLNGDDSDEVYGTAVPAVGFTLISAPGDDTAAGYYQPLSFGTYSNDLTPNGNPQTGVEYYSYLNGRNRNGELLDSPYVQLLDGGALPCASGEVPGDRRAIIGNNSAGQRFYSESKRHYAFALVVAPNAGGCPSVDIAPLQETADTAWEVYYNTASTGIAQPHTAAGIALWPNPAKGTLNIRLKGTTAATATITDVQGCVLIAAQSINQGTDALDVRALPPGVYVLRVEQGGRQSSRLFVKE